jgi:hypothetical protein
MRGRLDILVDAVVALLLCGVLYVMLKWIGEW